LIPISRGVAHLINGIFFAPKPEQEPQISFKPDFAPPSAQQSFQPAQATQPAYASAVANPATNSLEIETPLQTSVNEDQTLRFEAK
jgi:hypothetical protein